MLTINGNAPVVSCFCKEPEGVHFRNVYPMDMTVENLRKFWDKAQKYRYIFGQEATENFETFCESIMTYRDGKLVPNGLFWVVDDFVGVFYMTRIRPGEDADVHYTFFDGRQKGRQELTKMMLRYVFMFYGFQRLTTEIPYYASWSTRNFAESIGFVKEGRKRKAAPFKDEWFDIAIFGILKDEVLNG